MTITADTLVVGVTPRISRDSFIAWLQSVKSPAAAEAGSGYDVMAALHVDPLFGAACFWHESNAATNPGSIDVLFDTKNPGNCRSSRTGIGTIITTPRGPFVKYPSWAEGWRDFAFRLMDPKYVYVQGGLTTPGTIIPEFAPAEDGNDPTGYLQSVLAFMTQHQEESVSNPVDDSVAVWTPSPNFDSGRNGQTIQFIILHTTEGGFDGSVGWLRNPQSQASAHYVASADGSKVDQLVKEADTAWAAGNLDFNQRGVNIEQEGFAAKGGFSDGLYETVGSLVGRIARRHNIPLAYTGKTGKPGIIGHMDVPDGQGGWGGTSHHHDPGPSYDFDKVIAIAQGQTAVTASEPSGQADTRYFPETQHYLSHGFLRFWESYGDKAVPTLGYPISEEFSLNGLTVQYCERCRLEWHPDVDTGNDWHVQLGLLGSEDAAKARQDNPDAFKPAKAP